MAYIACRPMNAPDGGTIPPGAVVDVSAWPVLNVARHEARGFLAQVQDDAVEGFVSTLRQGSLPDLDCSNLTRIGAYRLLRYLRPPDAPLLRGVSRAEAVEAAADVEATLPAKVSADTADGLLARLPGDNVLLAQPATPAEVPLEAAELPQEPPPLPPPPKPQANPPKKLWGKKRRG